MSDDRYERMKGRADCLHRLESCPSYYQEVLGFWTWLEWWQRARFDWAALQVVVPR